MPNKGANGLVPGSANPAWLVGGKRLDLGVDLGLGQNEFVRLGDLQHISRAAMRDF